MEIVDTKFWFYVAKNPILWKNAVIPIVNIINMLDFLVDTVYDMWVFAGKVSQQIVGILMGTNCVPLLANVFLYP